MVIHGRLFTMRFIALVVLVTCLFLIGNAQMVTNVFIDFDSGSNGDNVTLDLITNSTHGAAGSFSYSATALSNFTFSIDAQKNLAGAELIYGVGTFCGCGLVGIKMNTEVPASIKYTSSIKKSRCSLGWWVKNGIPGDLISYVDSMIIVDKDANGYANCAIAGGGSSTPTTFRFALETPGDPSPFSVNYYNKNSWYWLTMLYDSTGHNELKIYNDAMVYQETISSIGNRAGSTNADNILIGPVILGQSTPGMYLYYDNIIVDFENGIFPLLPGVKASTVSTFRIGSLKGK